MDKVTGGFCIFGGAATCYEPLVEAAGGSKAKFIIFPHASSAPRQSADRLEKSLREVGAQYVDVLMPRISFHIPSGTTAVVLAGGDQSRLVRKLGKPGILLLHSFLAAGGLVAGTSAGAACLGEQMITGGMADGVIRKDSLLTGPGLGLLPRLIVDTHFLQRSRFNRLAVAVSKFSQMTGVGLDENTGICIRDGTVKVVGTGHVWLFKRGDEFGCEIERAGVGTVRNMLVSIYSAGDCFSV